MQAKIDKQANNLNGLKPKIEKVDTSRPSASFKLELANVSEFFDLDDNLEYGDRFWCRGMQWSIYVKNNVRLNESQPLGLFLRCHNDDPRKWSCHAVGKLILFNSSKNQNKTWSFDHTFGATGRDEYNCGNSYLISYSDITDEKDGFVKGDKIVVGVELNAGPVVRVN